MSVEVHGAKDSANDSARGSATDGSHVDTTQSSMRVRGTLFDSVTGETLPSGTVQITGTYKGTVSNAEGRYEIFVDSLPAQLTVQFLGYQSQQATVTSQRDSVIDFNLSPSSLELPELVITEDDPALSIMERVIARKQIWRAGLYNFKAEAYTRLSLSNDSSVVLITESINDVYWDRKQGYREILKTYEKTSNLDDTIIPLGVNDLPNFYDDNIDILNYDVVGVTHPDALDYYEFTLLDYESIDEQLIYKIQVTPRRALQPTFEGTIYVLAQDYAMLEVNLRPSQVITFPPPAQDVSFTYSQQYSNYGKDVWLPVDSRIEGSLKIGLPGFQIPTIQVKQVARVSEYNVNTVIPATILKKEELVTVDSLSISSTQIGDDGRARVPLTSEEDEAYQQLDSTMTLDKAFQPTGFLARFLESQDEDQDTSRVFGDGPVGRVVSTVTESVDPTIRADRVNGVFLGGTFTKAFGQKEERGEVALLLNGGYAFHRGAWDRGIGLRITKQFDQGLELTGESTVQEAVVPRQQLRLMPRSSASTSFIFGGVDPLDYYLQRGWTSSIGIQKNKISLTTRFQALEEESYQPDEYYTYSLTGSRDQPRRINPAIEDGVTNRLGFTMQISESSDFDGLASGFAGVNRIGADVEVSDASIGSDHDYVRVRVDGELSFDTFYKRRFLPNTFSMLLSGGASQGHLPYQRLFTLEPSMVSFAPFGVMKTQSRFAYEGDRFWKVYAEHDFKSTPFEALGLWGISKRGIGLIVFGGAANTWVSDPTNREALQGVAPILRESRGVHYEAGASINGIFSILRLDAAFRLDQADYTVTVGITRFF
ncbi:MAG: DUF5686 family protein [Balneolaceae bacterium]|nr:DUF5686 family protein [Balneolaceae bacterium]